MVWMATASRRQNSGPQQLISQKKLPARSAGLPPRRRRGSVSARLVIAEPAVAAGAAAWPPEVEYLVESMRSYAKVSHNNAKMMTL